MGLHDTDKSSDNRLDPTLNASDGVKQRMSHNTHGTTFRTDASTGQQRIVYKNGLILTYDQANRVSSVYGYVPSVSDVPVLIIAKAGYDVFVDILDITAPTT